MPTIEYVKFSEVNPESFLPLLNKLKIREHLIQHELFDRDSAAAWMKSKVDVDASHGCKVRAINVDDQLIGWCGIQLEDAKYEIAIVIDDGSWGLGIKIFHEMMGWAKAMGHDEVYIHFLHTRPNYKFLQKMAKKTYESDILGNKFNTYLLAVN
ncbi:GNAT family N-acetyltransferase [Marinomonas transparens]|uniref:N-acetyltransferase n=1 Tax=Marinomonas transparens TaxID=2795388 RepID=A0A934JXZ8_9GAMM|nr:N-acetyltransferase [Marinomonas transparens]MBJ7539007.1 N-acetyltransferase [Marinomonas transparens]